MLLHLFVQPNDFADELYVLHVGVKAFARVALLFQRQVLLVFVHATSEDEVGACTSGILVVSCSFQSLRYVFASKKFHKGIALAKV